MIRLFNPGLKNVRTAASAVALVLSMGSALAGNADLRIGARVQPAGEVEAAVQMKRSALAPVAATVVDLGEWVAPKAAADGNSNLVKIGAKRQVQAAASAQATQALLHWQASAQGGQVAAIHLVSSGAFGLRAGLHISALPDNATVRVYAPEQRDQAFEIAGQRIEHILANNDAAGDTTAAASTWWTPAVDGDELVIEIELPAGVASRDVAVAVPSLLHIYENIFTLLDDGSNFDTKLGNAAACTLDSTCYDAYAAQRNAVARMHYVQGDSGYLCTGTLLNDRAGSGTPYFMTANHCISSQTVASTLQTFWFYRTPSCNSTLLSSATKTLKGGAKLLYTNTSPDATLLVLNDTPPAGAVFAGWDANAIANGAAAVGIHHPRGDLQKISFGNVVGTAACTAGTGFYSCSATNAMTENFYRVQWSQGMTEGGSSGSALFVNGVVTGMLSNGSASCSKTGATVNYARFDKVFPAIKQWLAPEVAQPAAPTPVAPAATIGNDNARASIYSVFNSANGTLTFTNVTEERDALIAAARKP